MKLIIILSLFGMLFASIHAICFKPQSCTGEWDYELCQCYPNYCDPTPGCESWINYPTCQCFFCSTEPCPNNLPREPLPSCQCPAVCNPPYPPPTNKIWLGYPQCTFVCDPNLPACSNGLPRDVNCNCVVTSCITQPCLLSQYWSDPLCRCVCRYPKTCYNGKIWSEETCRCVSPTLSLSQTCQPTEPCAGTWDTTTCQCYIIVCDPGPEIPPGTNTWLGYPDCKWACVQQTCSNGQRWNKKKCQCV